MRRMGDILNKKVGRPSNAAGGTIAQAGNAAQIARRSRQLEGTPDAEAYKMSLPSLVGQGLVRRVTMKRARVTAEKIIEAPQEKHNQKNQGLTRSQSLFIHDLRGILSKSRRTGKAFPRTGDFLSSLVSLFSTCPKPARTERAAVLSWTTGRRVLIPRRRLWPFSSTRSYRRGGKKRERPPGSGSWTGQDLR